MFKILTFKERKKDNPDYKIILPNLSRRILEKEFWTNIVKPERIKPDSEDLKKRTAELSEKIQKLESGYNLVPLPAVKIDIDNLWIDALIESIKLGQHNEIMINKIKTRIGGDDSKFIGKVIERVRVMQAESQEGSTTAQPTSQPSLPQGGENSLGARLGR